MRFIHSIVIPVHYRPQRSCGQGNNFTPVCHSVHGGGGGVSEADPPGADAPGSRHPPGVDSPRQQTSPHGADTPQSRHPEQTPPGADTPQSRHPQEQTHPLEQTPPEQTPPQEQRPPRSRLQHTVKKRPVRILLECILVHNIPVTL